MYMYYYLFIEEYYIYYRIECRGRDNAIYYIKGFWLFIRYCLFIIVLNAFNYCLCIIILNAQAPAGYLLSKFLEQSARVWL